MSAVWLTASDGHRLRASWMGRPRPPSTFRSDCRYSSDRRHNWRGGNARSNKKCAPGSVSDDVEGREVAAGEEAEVGEGGGDLRLVLVLEELEGIRPADDVAEDVGDAPAKGVHLVRGEGVGEGDGVIGEMGIFAGVPGDEGFPADGVGRGERGAIGILGRGLGRGIAGCLAGRGVVRAEGQLFARQAGEPEERLFGNVEGMRGTGIVIPGKGMEIHGVMRCETADQSRRGRQSFQEKDL